MITYTFQISLSRGISTCEFPVTISLDSANSYGVATAIELLASSSTFIPQNNEQVTVDEAGYITEYIFTDPTTNEKERVSVLDAYVEAEKLDKNEYTMDNLKEEAYNAPCPFLVGISLLEINA